MQPTFIRLGWVKPIIIENLKGITVGALDKRKVRGKLIEGIHWKKVHGTVMYHYERIDQLFEDIDESAA